MTFPAFDRKRGTHLFPRRRRNRIAHLEHLEKRGVNTAFLCGPTAASPFAFPVYLLLLADAMLLVNDNHCSSRLPRLTRRPYRAPRTAPPRPRSRRPSSSTAKTSLPMRTATRSTGTSSPAAPTTRAHAPSSSAPSSPEAAAPSHHARLTCARPSPASSAPHPARPGDGVARARQRPHALLPRAGGEPRGEERPRAVLVGHGAQAREPRAETPPAAAAAGATAPSRSRTRPARCGPRTGSVRERLMCSGCAAPSGDVSSGVGGGRPRPAVASATAARSASMVARCAASGRPVPRVLSVLWRRPGGGGLTFDVDVRRPHARRVRQLARAALVQGGVVAGAGSRGRWVERVEGCWEGRWQAGGLDGLLPAT